MAPMKGIDGAGPGLWPRVDPQPAPTPEEQRLSWAPTGARPSPPDLQLPSVCTPPPRTLPWRDPEGRKPPLLASSHRGLTTSLPGLCPPRQHDLITQQGSGLVLRAPQGRSPSPVAFCTISEMAGSLAVAFVTNCHKPFDLSNRNLSSQGAEGP